MYRNDRSLEETSRKLRKKSPDLIESTLRELVLRGSELAVLEVGFGQGRALLELAWRFRDAPVRFFGVDKTRQPPVERREDLRRVARHFALASDPELAAFELPEIDFYDARRLAFPSESIDLVYSAVTIRHMEQKAEFLEEVSRVLTLGGMALLHIGESGWDYPHAEAEPEPRLTDALNRFVLRHGTLLVPLPSYLRLFEGSGFGFEWIERRRCVLRLTKSAPGKLDLGLVYHPELSFPMTELGHPKQNGGVKGGFRSVYDVPEDRYASLIERGLLTRIEAR